MAFNYDEDILKKIKSRREEFGMSRNELGKLIGVDRVTIYNWENSKNSISIKNLIKLCEVLKLDLQINITPKEKNEFCIDGILKREDEELMRIIGDRIGL